MMLPIMVKLLIYAYATGVFSSRGMAKKLATETGRATYATRKWISDPPTDRFSMARFVEARSNRPTRPKNLPRRRLLAPK